MKTGRKFNSRNMSYLLNIIELIIKISKLKPLCLIVALYVRMCVKNMFDVNFPVTFYESHKLQLKVTWRFNKSLLSTFLFSVSTSSEAPSTLHV